MEKERMHILVVDDVLKNLQVTAQLLKEEGYQLSLAQDGKGALSILEEEIPDLILLDIMMPGMDGLEVCRRIKRIDKVKDVPVVFLTAFNQSQDLLEGFRAGGVVYISKPYNREELLIRIRTHLDLSVSKKKLTETIKTRDKLYSMIAHDIRAPLSNIMMLAKTISDGSVKWDEQRLMETIRYIDKAAGETFNLLNNLLNWTKLQVGTITLYPQQMNVKSVIDDCIRLFSYHAAIKHIVINTSVDPSHSGWFDEVTIHTVFRNLISNAIKFTPENGSIDIISEKLNLQVWISIRDNGVGIPLQMVRKIAEENEFFSTPGTEKEQGSGLGLHLVKALVEQNHGVVEIESEEGKGTLIRVRLPVNENALNPSS